MKWVGGTRRCAARLLLLLLPLQGARRTCRAAAQEPDVLLPRVAEFLKVGNAAVCFQCEVDCPPHPRTVAAHREPAHHLPAGRLSGSQVLWCDSSVHQKHGE